MEMISIRNRAFHWNEDFETVRQFLIEIWNEGPLYRNWIPSMFENMKFGPGGKEYVDEDDEHVRIWEGPDSRIIGVSIAKPSGECWVHIHPQFLDCEREIILWIEEQRSKTKSSSGERVRCHFVVEEHDHNRIEMLRDLGYERSEIEGISQVRKQGLSIPDYHVPEGYSVRNAEIMEEWEEYRRVQMAVFSHVKEMSRKMLELYSKASFYIPELDIVAVDPKGRFAAFCTGRIDPVSRIAELEPVGTHPDHRKKGLAKAVIIECLKRLESHNPVAVVILGAAPTEGANRLYESVGFENLGERHIWSKDI